MLLEEILNATNGKLLSGNLEDMIVGFTNDSRKCGKNYLYFAIKGERFDGHDFIDSALENGASTIITEKIVEHEGKNIILVNDSIKALGELASYYRDKSGAKVVAITGSVGKTSTKDLIYSVISQKFKTLKTPNNYNNHIGLPLTILSWRGEDVMVLEMGMNHLNEIDYLTKIAKPNIAVITNVGTAHIGLLGSKENILKAKMEITHGLQENGTLILNKDSEPLKGLENKEYTIKYISQNETADLQAYNICLNEDSSDFKLNYQNEEYSVHVPVAGAHFINNALLALEVGICLGINIDDCIAGIREFKLTENRADVISLRDGILLYDGTYNANLDSIKASIDVICRYPNRKIAVLGDMLELGEYDQKLHEEMGEYLLDKKIDMVLLVGNSVKYTYDILQKTAIKCKLFTNNSELKSYLYSEIKPGDVILIKASYGLNLVEVVQYLKEEFKK